MRAMNFDKPDWQPLERVLGLRCAFFMWMWREGDVQFYKHINTRHYIRLDSRGECFREGPNGLEPANLEEELRRVFE